jgi:Fe-S oxidoreductase
LFEVTGTGKPGEKGDIEGVTMNKLKQPDHITLKDLIRDSEWTGNVDDCISCSTCDNVCPVSDFGEDHLSPRRLVRLVQYGLDQEIVNSEWIWQCTNCMRCVYNCPMGIKINNIISVARGMVDKDKSPGTIQKTADNHITTGNNMELSEEDFLDTVEWMTEELEDEIEDIEVPVDKKGAEYAITINSKLPMHYPLELQHIFKVFHAAKIDWTVPSNWWEGTNYAMFTSDLDTWEKTLRNFVDKIHELGSKYVAYTECGHGYFAFMSGLERFNIPHDFEIIHVVKLYAQWIREGRFKLDPSRNPQLITLHDPCNAVRKASMYGFPDIADDARFVLKNICENFIEMTPNRNDNICCSGGGGALIGGFKKARDHYGKMKVDQIDKTEAGLVCTPCVNCLDGIHKLQVEYKKEWKSIHMWELLANAIVIDD